MKASAASASAGRIPPYHLAYVFERFPSFTQTFCVREIEELERQGLRPLIFSIHSVADESVRHFSPDLLQRVHVLPPEKELAAQVREWISRRQLPQSIVLTLRMWGDREDKARVYEAAWIGMKMREAGVQHAHSHFAGIGARTCWWLRQFFGCSYSFTGHANDLFCESGLPLNVQRLAADAALVVTVSDFTGDWLRGHCPGAAGKVRRVYNGLDVEGIVQRTAGQAKAAPPLILSVGRLIEKKGFDDLVRACAQLKREGRDFQCVIAGDGPLEQPLRELLVSLAVDDRVHLAGAKSQEEILDLLGGASIFALPCVVEESGGMDNLPTVIMEAMAAGIPCASTRLAGVPEMVQDGVTGWLCEPRQPEAFARLLAKLLEDAPSAARMGEMGRARAREIFAREKTAAQLLGLLLEYGQTPRDDAWSRENPVVRRALARQWRHKLRRMFARGAAGRKCAILPERGGRIRYVREGADA